ncbi:MAG: small, acid-soluble spore protein, alpha/beta type [Lachnospiraceae bacterium]|nr:small, acid-soluble spore protein, alpha/beta type [Lachnospiraceae bacterium]
MAKEKKEMWGKLTQEDLLKYEVAEELGLLEKVQRSGWKSLSAKESGKLGGMIATKKRQMKKEALQEMNYEE